MCRCLVTGATGFIGKLLVEGLLKQGHDLLVLVRNPDTEKCSELISKWRALSLVLDNGSSLDVWCGDLNSQFMGLDKTSYSFSDFDHVFHLAAVYDLGAPEKLVMETNVQGTERLFSTLVSSGFAGRVHMLSSMAVAGDFQGTFSEDMFDEGQEHSHTYHLSKFQSEACARRFRDEHNMDLRIYRPSAVVGDSTSGEIDKIDGPYYMCLLVSFLKRYLPSWVPILVPKLKANLDVVPRDYLVEAILLLSQSEDLGGQTCFHLTGTQSLPLHKAFTQILRAADGPKVGFSLPVRSSGIQGGVFKQLGMLKQLKAVQIALDGLFEKLGIPSSVFSALMPGLKFSADSTQKLLVKQGLRAPAFEDYVDQLWDYYNRYLDPAKNRENLAELALKNKTVLITGGSSGIGYASAKRALSYGARVILVARHQDKLNECKEALIASGVDPERIDIYTCDLSHFDECDALVTYIEDKYVSLDVLFSNAGRSIRRSLSRSEGRFHDLERTMQLNYFGASRLILGLLPSMVKNGGGHILHSSSMGTMAVTPRFGPYMASKSAMDALCDSLAAEFANRDISVTSIKFPLVKTEMVAPTKEYKNADLVSAEDAAQMFIDAVIDKPRKQLTGVGLFLGAISLYAPELVTQIYNYLYQIWPDEQGEYPEMGLDRALLTSIVPNSPL